MYTCMIRAVMKIEIFSLGLSAGVEMYGEGGP